MIALLDGDVVLYRTGFAADAQNAPMEINLVRAEETIRNIMNATHATSLKVYLSDTLENNFRYKIYPEYKANRKDAPRPKYYADIKQFLINEFDAVITTGQEADDALGIDQTYYRDELQQGWSFGALIKQEGKTPIETNGEPCCICSIDKDLLQVPGMHYNFVKGEIREVTELDGLRHFYEQLLKGDRTDNIPGIDRIGEKKAAKLMANCESEADMLEIAFSMWDEDIDRMTMVGQLLWVRRKEGEIWKPPMHLLET